MSDILSYERNNTGWSTKEVMELLDKQKKVAQPVYDPCTYRIKAGRGIGGTTACRNKSTKTTTRAIPLVETKTRLIKDHRR
jgi:hypothetical protein